MAKYVKTDYVPEDVKNLTVNKEYEVFKCNVFGGDIIDDYGNQIHVHYGVSAHLDNRAWTVINR